MLTEIRDVSLKLGAMRKTYQKKHGPRRPNYFAQWRKSRGLNKRQVAEILDISESQVGRYESGETRYNQDYLEDLAHILHCDPAALISGPPGHEPQNGISEAIAILEAARKQRARR